MKRYKNMYNGYESWKMTMGRTSGNMDPTEDELIRKHDWGNFWESCWGPLMDQNLVVQSQRWESERRKEANIPWITQPAFALQGISQK